MTTILLNNPYKSIFCTLALLFSSTASQTLTAATLSTGGFHTCLIKHDGTLACWGITEDGRATPPSGTFSQVSVGWDHACALRTDGTLICWGRKGSDQPAPLAGNFSQVSAGDNYTCVLRTDGIPTCWGDNSDGQTAPPAGTFTQISTGWYHACGIKTDKTVVCWGKNDYQQATPPEGEFSQVTANGYHSCGIKTDGTVVCWGNTSSNKAIRPPSGIFTQIAAGFKYTCGIKTDSTLVCWGDNDYGQTLFPLGTFVQVSAGYLYACGVKSEGTVTCWGDNSEGQAAPPFEVTLNCIYHLEPASYFHAATASKGTVTVTASAAECPWTVSSQVDWVTIMSGDGGRGSGLVTYAVAANSNEQNRAGVLLIAGQPFTVSQWTNATLPVDTQNAFSMPVTAEAIKTESQTLSVQTPPKEFRSQTFPITLPNNIYGLSITGQFGLRLEAMEDDPAAFVRVVLVDNNTQSEYLVYEKSLQSLTTEEYNSPRPLKIEKVCEETCVLPQPLNSFSLRLEVRHGALSIGEVSYVETPIASDIEELRAKQNAVKIWQLNEQDLGWIAGETSVSNLSYAEKKRLLGSIEDHGEFNLQGLEYYRGGIFGIVSKSASTRSRIRQARDSSLVENFNWADKHHGKDCWVTPVKFQPCGNCWTFSTAGALEAVTNLYFNQCLNLDLAEQDTLSCSGAGSCNGGVAGGAFDYFQKTGIVDEACFPNSGTDQDCRNKCSNPQELIQLSGRIPIDSPEFPRTEDAIKRLLIENGPMTASVKSLGHAMNLVGFKKDPFDGRTIWIFKNSWGKNWGAKPGGLDYGSEWGEYWKEGYAEGGYVYIKLNINNFSGNTNVIKTPIISKVQPRKISCVDQDNDGYCNWGISKDKPSTCPASCKPEKDCDDSNPDLAVFDANYNCTGKPQPQPPIAMFTANPLKGVMPLKVTFDASGSRDPDGTIAVYQWFIDGQLVGTGNPFTYNFDKAGQFEVTLTVTDQQRLTAVTKKVVTVVGQYSPVATFVISPANTGEVPFNVTLNAGGSYDPDGKIVSYQWHSSEGQTASGKNAAMIFNTPGSYTITLTVTDNDNLTGQTQKQVTVTGNYVPVNSGIITTVAGNGAKGFGGDGGPATNALLDIPSDVAVDRSGNLYVADEGNHRIRKIDPAGIITTMAGNGGSESSGDGGFAINAQIGYPSAVDVDSRGNLYISDGYNNRIRKVDTTGIITTVVGNDVKGFSGDGGATISALIEGPISIALDNKGNLYFAEWDNNRVRKVDTAGIITTVAGNDFIPGNSSFSGDGGPATSALLNAPYDIAVDNNDNLYIADHDNHRIRKVDANGIITTVAGNGITHGEGISGFSGDGGSATNAEISFPKGVAIDSGGNLYIADSNNHRVRKVDTAGIITTVAGNGVKGFSGDGGPAISAQLGGPDGRMNIAELGSPLRVAVDNIGNLYIADGYNHRVRKVTFNNGTPCTYTVTPTTVTHGYGSETGTLTVSAPADCSWTATSNNDEWITITSGKSGQGNGTVTYLVTDNVGMMVSPGMSEKSKSRSGTLTVAGQTITVNQLGEADCTYTITPTTTSHSANSETGTLTITAPTGCSWIATSNDKWITITSEDRGQGNGTVTYSVADNTNAGCISPCPPSQRRSGTISVAGQTVTVTQNAIMDLTNGLVAYYPFNGNANDESGNGNSGTVDGATLTEDRSGNLNSAYSFDGVNDKIYFTQKHFARNNQLSVSVWLKANPDNKNLFFAMCSDFGMWNSDIEAGLAISLPGTDSASGTLTGFGEWNHLVGTYDGTYIQTYINGNLTGKTLHEGTLSDPNRSLTLGVFSQTDTYYWAGVLDDIRIYNRVLSETEVRTLFNDNVFFSNSTQPKVEVANPIVSQAIYQTGETLRVTLSSLPAGQEQYVGIGLPNGSLYLLNQLNSFIPFDNVTFPVWSGGEVAIDKPVTADLPSGLYTVYLLRLPTGVRPSSVKMEDWALGSVVFNINHLACTYTVTPANISHSTQSETGTVTVNTPAGCPWTATSNAPWLTITSAKSGQGNGTVTYSVKSNFSECVSPACLPSQSRSGTLTIAGQLVTVNQQGGR